MPDTPNPAANKKLVDDSNISVLRRVGIQRTSFLFALTVTILNDVYLPL